MRTLLVLLGFVAVQAAAARSTTEVAENPIRRIVNLLQMMLKEIEADGEKDKDMTEKYICYCETNVKKLDESLAALKEEIPQIESSLKGAVSMKAQVEEELAQAKKDRTDANAAIDDATAQREKEAKAYAAEAAEDKANIAACTKAVAAIEKGLGGSFLQTAAAGALRSMVLNSESMDRYTRRMLTDFLSTDQQEDSPGSGEIVGILKQLLESMETEYKECTDAENSAIAEFESLVAAKEKEIAAATSAVEVKTGKVGELAVSIVNFKNDLADAQDAFGEDEVFLAELKKGCAVAQKEYDARVKARSEESVAVQETVKILNDDDALDLFKKTLPSPSFAQGGQSFLQVTQDQDTRDMALEHLQDVTDKNHNDLGMIQLALMGKKVNFDKIVKMIDDLVVVLGDEQKADEEQKEWCEAEFESSDDKKKELKFKIEGIAASIEEMTEGVAKLTDEIKALTDGITALDTSVAEATATRKEEHDEFVTVSAQNNAAVQLLEVAKNRLNKFYNPTLYKAPARRELTEEERIYVANGGADPRDAEEAAAPQGIAGTGVAVFLQLHAGVTARAKARDDVAPPPPPATADAFKKKDAGGPVALIDKLKNELKMEIKETEYDEKEAQEDYEELMADSAKKRAADSKTITEKESQKAGMEGDLEAAKKSKKAEDTNMMALKEYIAGLHSQCDFLIENFEMRKDARSNEIDALKKAVAVLSGADYSLLQVKTKTFLSK
jgi:chromosome segregation ATPase